jgi:protein-S-isoprenylcysteine O-methyltransferase Ste14
MTRALAASMSQALPPARSAAARRLGGLLVALQFALLAVLAALAGPRFALGLAPLGAWLLLAHAAALGLWAVATNRPGNFNIRPMPREGGQLVQGGPYRWVRHPMYSSLLMTAAAGWWALAADEGLGWAGPWAVMLAGAAVLALAAVLAAKAHLEERWMLLQHAAYADYRRRTRRFVPLLW